MIIGIPKEIKDGENRVALTPDQVHALSKQYSVLVGEDAGLACGYTNEDYDNAGAMVVLNAQVYAQADLVVKVKEPLAEEVYRMKKGATVLSYLHLAASPLTEKALKEMEINGIPLEEIRDASGNFFPLLKPMSEIAGQLAAVEGERYLLEKKGILLSEAKVVVFGGGQAGTSAALHAKARGANVVVIDKSYEAIARLNMLDLCAIGAETPDSEVISETIAAADLLVGAVLIPGKQAPVVITEAHIRSMEKDSVFVDIAIDQGGCSETSYPTTHSDPIYMQPQDGVWHYCVTNMPGKAYRTATKRLSEALYPHVLDVAKQINHD
jgi:alanine dehydrogenase